MASDVIYTDSFGREVGYLPWATGDFIEGDRNTLSLKVPVMDALAQDCYLMIDGTEYGGVIDGLRIDTSKSYMEVTGRTWTGILESSVIVPPSGQSHYVVSGDANAVIKAVIERQGLGFCMCAEGEPSGFALSSYQFDRYCTAYEGLRKALASVGAQLSIAYDGAARKAKLSAVKREDLRGNPIDGDRAKFTLTQTRPVNHIVALGSGEGTARLVLHAWADADGNVVPSQALFGIEEKTEVYDNTNADDAARLREDAEKRLADYQENIRSFQMSEDQDGAYGVGALIAAVYAPRNTVVEAVIVRKTASVSKRGITYKTVCKTLGA